MLRVKTAASARDALVDILRHAYSGERAAALAYAGHWRSLRPGEDRVRIQEIEREEWHHRDLVGEMLAGLGAQPSAGRERRARVVGTILSALCRVTGWLAPMYAAGRLESGNIREYEHAAILASACGRGDLVGCLLDMAAVEWEHESYFRARVETHPLARWIPRWPAPPPKERIRRAFAQAEESHLEVA